MKRLFFILLAAMMLRAVAGDAVQVSDTQLVKTTVSRGIISEDLISWPFTWQVTNVSFTPQSPPPNISPLSSDSNSVTPNPVTVGLCPVDSDGDGVMEAPFSLTFNSLRDLGEWRITFNGTWIHPSDCVLDPTSPCGVTCNPINASPWGEPITFVITVTNDPPTANITHSPTPAWNQTVTLNANANDPDGVTNPLGTNALVYRWSIVQRPPGSTTNLTGANTATPTLPFSSDQDDIGDWRIQLNLDDDEGERRTFTHDLTVPNVPPNISITDTNTGVTTNSTSIDVLIPIDLQITPTTDVDGEETFNVAWEIRQSPPGSMPRPPQTGIQFHMDTVETDIGTWVIRATATDNEGDSGSAEITVEVNNLPPPDINSGSSLRIDIGDTFRVEPINEITDPDGGDITFRWDIVQAPQSSGRIVQQDFRSGAGVAFASLGFPTTYNDAGTWIFQLTATDNDNAPNSEKSAEFMVLVNAPPQATITGQDTIGSLSFPLVLDGSGSLDPDSPCPGRLDRCHDTFGGRPVTVSPGIEQYTWSLIDVPFEFWPSHPPGIVDESLGVNAHDPTLTLAFAMIEQGEWTFQLEVIDGEENADQTTFTVTVVDENGPPIAIVSAPTRYTVDLSGLLSQDITLNGSQSLDLDNLLVGGTLSPGMGITNYSWEVVVPPPNCTPPTLLSGATNHTVNLFTAGSIVPPNCQGFWTIRLTVTDDDTPARQGIADTSVIIGNCPGALCIDYPTTLNPQPVEFVEDMDILIWYHLNSVLYSNPAFLNGMFTSLEIFHQSNLANPVFTSTESNLLPTNQGGCLPFNWHGYTNSGNRPQPGLYTIKISLLDYAQNITTFSTTETEAIQIEVATPSILPTSDKYISFDHLNAGTDQIDLNYEVTGGVVPDEVRWRVFDASQTPIIEDAAPSVPSGTISWDGQVGGTTIAAGHYDAEVEAFRTGASLGVSDRHSIFVIKVDLDADLNRDGAFSEDDPEEHTLPGMLIFLNSDDDDANGTADFGDTGDTSENDLLDLQLTGIPSSVDAGKVTLEAIQGSNSIKVWSSAQKGSGNLIFDASTGKKEWVIGSDISSLGELPGTLYIEAVSPRTTVGDVVVQLRYEESGSVLSSDDIWITVMTEEDVVLYDTAYPVNEADLYPPLAGDTPTLVFYHDCPTLGNETRGTSSLKLTFSSPDRLLYRYDKLQPSITPRVASGTLGSTPIAETLVYYNDTNGDRDADMQVWVGIDIDKNGTLQDEEARAKFNLHLVTDDNYQDSIWEVNNITLTLLNDMSDALFRHLATGSFAGADADFIPNLVAGGITVGGSKNTSLPHRFTHNFGATFTGTGSSATAAVLLFEYPLGSDGSDLVSNAGLGDNDYRAGIVSFMENHPTFSYANVRAMFVSLGGGAVGKTYTATFPNLEISMDLGIVEIGMGNVTARGSIVASLTRTGTNEYQLHEVRAILTIEDLFDFNYFKPGRGGWTGQSQNGTSIQAGFGKCGNAAGVGQSFVTRVITDRTFDGLPLTPTASITITKTP